MPYLCVIKLCVSLSSSSPQVPLFCSPASNVHHHKELRPDLPFHADQFQIATKVPCIQP